MDIQNNLHNTNKDSLPNNLRQALQSSLRTVSDESWFVIRPDIFAVPYLDGFLLYSPLQGLLLLITRAGLGSLVTNTSSSVSQSLLHCEILGDSEIITLFDTHPKQEPSIYSKSAREFRPTHLTLSTTSACQLACRYCYIRGGDKPRNMPWEIADAAIRFTIDNARTLGQKKYSLEFHGQGEPTANWYVFRRAVLLTSELCESHKLEPTFSVVTNGILNENKIAFFANNKISVGLSFDGLKRSMDYQRPLRGRGSSFDRVMKTIRSFERIGIEYAIRSTITSTNLYEMTDFISFIKDNTSCRYVNFEPVSIVGRASDDRITDNNIILAFTQNFRKAASLGAELGIQVGYSSCRLDGLRSTFCGAYGPNPNFCVSNEGIVSSCYEVLYPSDPRARIFVYGRYDSSKKAFDFFYDRLSWLLDLNVTRMKRCHDCFAKWNCGGDCISKVAYEGVELLINTHPLERCSTNRMLIKDELVRSIFKNTDPISIERSKDNGL
jgi:uncharacterized protein